MRAEIKLLKDKLNQKYLEIKDLKKEVFNITEELIFAKEEHGYHHQDDEN